ncbi:sigma-54-dependent Fis family transcriptional regulator [Selenihalanaerobacter shriftii]|uniref:PAS domain S-box-containing protein n=1 Tax=Selenihalanaerobacter shriftii TaxID=142842 RepID=A0A1T4JJS1_9FIRM|nr:sigma 54-interacting transcriptional regulator [Selenihalanaerobacter shriftii]SJZ30368.1 PAS domain S-box-containing protein [Selenihalanaerobacter shriftii]
MVNLRDVEEFIQQVAEAFAPVLDYEVAVIDDALEVLAGTGRYQEEINTQYGPGSMTRKLISDPDQKALVVEDSKSSDLCEECDDRESCPVWAVIMCPIVYSSEVIGSLSLMAFNQEQQKNLISNRLKLITFLRKVAEFITNTLGEKAMKSQVIVMANKFKAVINSVHEGIIAINDQQQITHINQSAKEILKIGKEQIGKDISILFSDFDLDEVLNNMNEGNYLETRIKYRQENKKMTLISNITLIENDNKRAGATISFRELDEIKKLANKIIAKDNQFTFDNIKGTSEEITKIKDDMQRVAHTDSTVLIRGESGTGKSMFAKAIHEESDRRDESFIEVNCAAIPESLLESELFGYEEGAFTGAKKGGKPGKFELAHKGTIFLDEIGDMPTHFQVKLLKVIETKKIERVGGVESTDVDVRILAATHHNLEEMVQEGDFRKDLFYRLNVIPFYIPPLRKRKEDITLLLHLFLKEYTQTLQKDIIDFTKTAKKELLNYSWPGNVRELENTIEYAVNLETSNYITKESFPDRIIENETSFEFEDNSIIPTISELEQKAIIEALKEFGTSGKAKKRAAKALGISRATLYRKIKKFDIDSTHIDIEAKQIKELS